MFEKGAICYITRNTIHATSGDTQDSRLLEIDWDGVNPTTALEKVKNELAITTAKWIVGEDSSYVIQLELPKAEATRDKILKTIASQVPEEINETNFDWAKVGDNVAKKTEYIQVTVIRWEFLNALSYAAKEIKLAVTLIQPVSILLAQLTKQVKEPHLIIWCGFESLVVLAQSGRVLYTKSISELTASKLEEIFAYAKAQFGVSLDPTKLVYDPKFIREVNGALLEKANKKSLDLILEIAKQKRHHRNDKDSIDLKLSLSPTQPVANEADVLIEIPREELQNPDLHENPPGEQAEPITPQVDKTEEAQPKFNKKNLLFGLVSGTFAFVVGLGVFYALGQIINTTELPSTSPSPSADITASPPEATSSPSLSNELKVQILNGSGVVGEAAYVEGLLTPIGLTLITLGNADRYDYENTQLQRKETVTPDALRVVKSALEKEYLVSVSSDLLTKDSEYDLLIVVGKKK